MSYIISKVGGIERGSKNDLNSAEVFNCNAKKWKMISSMSTGRYNAGIGVLDNLIYVVYKYFVLIFK